MAIALFLPPQRILTAKSPIGRVKVESDRLAVLDHALLDAQPLTLEGSKQLLDVPAQAVPADHGECLLDTLDGVCRQQAPADRIAGWWIELANLDGEQLDLTRRIAIGAGARPTDANTSKTHGHVSRSSAAFARPRRQVEREAVRLGHLSHGAEQPAAVGQAAIAAGARQKVGALIRQASPFFVDIAFAVVDDGDHGRFGQHCFRLLPALHPAIGFLLLDRQTLVVRVLALGPAPHMHVDQTEAFLRLRVHAQHRMHEQSHVGAIADLAEPVLAPALRLIIDFAGILNGQHMPAFRCCRYEHRPMRHHFLDRDRLVRQEAAKLDLLPPIVRQLAHAHRLSFTDTLRDERAVPLQSGIAEISNSHLHRRPLFSNRDGKDRITPQSLYANRIALQQTNRSAISVDSHCNICAEVSPQGGRERTERVAALITRNRNAL